MLFSSFFICLFLFPPLVHIPFSAHISYLLQRDHWRGVAGISRITAFRTLLLVCWTDDELVYQITLACIDMQ